MRERPAPPRIYTRFGRTLIPADQRRERRRFAWIKAGSAARASLAITTNGVPWRPTMLDIVALAITVAFFAASIAYVHACERL